MKEVAERFTGQVDAEALDNLARGLGVTVAALRAVGVGWASSTDLRAMKAGGAGWPENYPDGAWTFAEANGAGQLVGFGLRAMDGRKGSPSSTVGAKRGLVVPAGLHESQGCVLVVEGASDVAAATVLGLVAVGRPSNSGGADDIRAMLRKRPFIIIGENDPKDTGAWPGRDGAIAVAQRIANASKEPARFTLPPAGTKDVRTWLQARIAEGLDVNDTEACKAAGAELLAVLTSAAEEVEPEDEGKVSTAEIVCRLAEELFRFGLSSEGEAFAVRREGPNIALPFRGSRDALRSTLAREYRALTGRTASSSALADALVALEGGAMELEREAVHLRVARHEDAIVLDVGNAEGDVVIVRPGSWEIANPSPVLFKRTALTGPLPLPERGGSLDELRELLNVTEDGWALLRGFMVAALIPDIAHAIALLTGLQGSGKTTAAKFIFGIFDASPCPVESPPSDVTQWAVRASAGWTVCIDNVSRIPEWFSEALCRASTGDGMVRRALYTDAALSILSFRRIVALTSIDAGALRGDLGQRLLMLDFEEIPPERRREELELVRLYEAARPRILGGLLDLLAEVLARLPDVKLERRERMADFGTVLAAMDLVDVSDGRALALYEAQSARVAVEVLDADDVAKGITAMMETAGEWVGTAAELLKQLTPADRAPKGWPTSAKAMGGRLRRLVPALRAVGVEAEFERATDAGRARLWTISKRDAKPTVRTVQPSESGPCDGASRLFGLDGSESQPSDESSNRPAPDDGPDDAGRYESANRPQENGPDGTENAGFGRSDGSDDETAAPFVLDEPADAEAVGAEDF